MIDRDLRTEVERLRLAVKRLSSALGDIEDGRADNPRRRAAAALQTERLLRPMPLPTTAPRSSRGKR